MPDVPAEFQTAVLFLGCRRGGVDPVGSAFYVTSSPTWNPDASPPEPIPSNYPNDRIRHGWLVTARHVIEGIARNSEDGKVLLMVNSRRGTRIEPPLEVDATDWILLPDDEDTGYLADIALLPFIRPDDYALAPIPIEASLTPSRMEHADVSPGVDVVYPSLYYQHPGERRNIPLMRTGTLAAVADYDEPVYVKDRERDAFAHLVEARSYRGVSGSPVFVVLPPARSKRHEGKSGTFIQLITHSEFYLLGVMITHLGLLDPRDMNELVNVGIGVVLDVSYIWKGISMAVEKEKAIEPEPEVIEAAASLDSVEVIEEPYIKQDYLRDLNRATRRVDERSDPEASETKD